MVIRITSARALKADAGSTHHLHAGGFSSGFFSSDGFASPAGPFTSTVTFTGWTSTGSNLTFAAEEGFGGETFTTTWCAAPAPPVAGGRPPFIPRKWSRTT